jgi:hypothetical protein
MIYFDCHGISEEMRDLHTPNLELNHKVGLRIEDYNP